MTFEKPREFVGEHKLATGAAAIGSAAVVAAAVAGYAAYRNKKTTFERELDESYADEYEKHLSIFEEEKLPEETRRMMARIAAHIFYNNESGEDFVTQQSLRGHFEAKHGEKISRHQFDDLAGHLKQHKIIGRKHGSGEQRRSNGYATLPALEWAVKYSNGLHPLLREALDEKDAELSGNL